MKANTHKTGLGDVGLSCISQNSYVKVLTPRYPRLRLYLEIGSLKEAIGAPGWLSR